MNENVKLEEARHFLRKLAQAGEPNAFQYELSAFMSATRSALQYALEEAKTKSGGQKWFDESSKAPLVEFFKKKRNLSIHEKPVVPRVDATIMVSALAAVAELAVVEVITPEGRSTRHAQDAATPQASTMSEQPAVVTYDYSFDDWSGPSEAVSLCAQYLEQVEAILKDGMDKGYVTG